MIFKVLTVFLLLSTVFVNTNAEYLYATDVAGNISVSQLNCIRSNGYSAIFTQIYSNNGYVDLTGFQNVISAYLAGLGTEVYISPYSINSPTFFEFDQIYKQFNSSNIHVRTIWLKVADSSIWARNPSFNIDFIKKIVTWARLYGITIGIYTNWYDWDRITGSTTTFQKYNLPLWYWNAYGYGPSAEGTADFSDFRSFGNWKSASAKEYGLKENLCSATISKIVYQKSASFLKFKSYKNMTQPVAGSAIF
uniref:Lysozyme n=1 Tax=Strongyloides papillosus TaxID=174720 RepID=A0A0N5BT73_STREA